MNTIGPVKHLRRAVSQQDTMSEPGTLYIVATPIGNLEDISLRALRILREADLIAAEDTRVTAKLLFHFQITTPTTFYHQHSGGKKAESLIAQLLAGKSVALVSDAGMPGISDPGHELIQMAIEKGIRTEPIPGPTAVITALVVSGLATHRFSFEGFPPRVKGERVAFFQALSRDPRTLLFYESPMRLVTTLKDMLQVFGDRKVSIGRELTKLHEEIFRGTISEALKRFGESRPRGEIVIVLDGAKPEESTAPEEPWLKMTLEAHLQSLMGEGLSEKEAIRRAALLRHLPKREVYAAALRMKEGISNEP